jgi:hypothetical protein
MRKKRRLAAKDLPLMRNKIIAKLAMCLLALHLPLCLKKTFDSIGAFGKFHIVARIVKLEGDDLIPHTLDDHIV